MTAPFDSPPEAKQFASLAAQTKNPQRDFLFGPEAEPYFNYSVRSGIYGRGEREVGDDRGM